jgi:hypothetical protein
VSKKQNTRFEKNIYVENRSGAFRFKVVIHPLHDSATFSTVEEGALWARRRVGIEAAQLRQDLQPQHSAASVEAPDPDSSAQGMAAKAP